MKRVKLHFNVIIRFMYTLTGNGILLSTAWFKNHSIFCLISVFTQMRIFEKDFNKHQASDGRLCPLDLLEIQTFKWSFPNSS